MSRAIAIAKLAKAEGELLVFLASLGGNVREPATRDEVIQAIRMRQQQDARDAKRARKAALSP